MGGGAAIGVCDAAGVSPTAGLSDAAGARLALAFPSAHGKGLALAGGFGVTSGRHAERAAKTPW
jgi:hypothetical protein